MHGIGREEIVEVYLHNAPGLEERDAFEAHAFECGACFDRLQNRLTRRDGLAVLPAEILAPAPEPPVSKPQQPGGGAMPEPARPTVPQVVALSGLARVEPPPLHVPLAVRAPQAVADLR